MVKMDCMDWSLLQVLGTSLGSVVAALGGWEAVRYFLNRKTDGRKAEAEADGVEFDVLKETVEFLQMQLKEKEERFAQQTELVRKLNTEVLELTKDKGRLELELQTYRCVRARCSQREPPNGF